MLSVCIPVYNYDIKPLIDQLYSQIKKCSTPVEIVVLDDGSSEHFRQINHDIKSLDCVRYFEQANSGRSKSRNRLAELANYPFLAYIDCDCEINDHYISQYIENLQANTVLVGGLLYPPKPQNKQLHLRWKAGVKKEVKPLPQRKANPYANFLSSNFVIPTTLIKQGGFDNRLSQYGHEDTMFGNWLNTNRIKIIHLNNPVIHMGIDTALEYLKKIEQSIDNIRIIYQSQGFTSEIRLLVFYQRLKKYKAERYFCMIFERCQSLFEAYFKAGFTSLIILDLYKLGLFCKLIRLNTSKL
jgi:glycosyltransferase involved in cell wall biosynthesis